MQTTIHLFLFCYCFRYVAPEYANTGLLNEKSDVYSFGVLLLKAVTGRVPVDYGRIQDGSGYPKPEYPTGFTR